MADFCMFVGLMVTNIVWSQFPPEQIHIMVGATPDVMTFNWVTMDYPVSTRSIVRAGLSSEPDHMNITSEGISVLFTDSGSLRTNRTIHVANITNLQTSTEYFYQVGDPQAGWSSVYSFKTQHYPSNNSPYKFLMFGDLGIYNSLCLNAMIDECLDGDVDIVLYFGDMAYNMNNNNGSYGDIFMNMLEPLGSRCPIMANPGNHEEGYNFSHYTERWRGMPNPGIAIDGTTNVHTYNGYAPNNWYYSYNIGPVHIISISTEIYFTQTFLMAAQEQWLVNDLEIASKNRTEAPWIIVHGHRNIYCSSVCGHFCTGDAYKVRASLEPIFFKYGVDFHFAGHEHNYERMYDIYQNYSNQLTTNMTSTTYIVSGAPGTCEYNNQCCSFYPSQPEWSAVRSLDYSYSRFYVYNKTHIHWQQVLYDGKTIIDDVWFEQYNHGPFNMERINEIKNKKTNESEKKIGKTVAFSDYDSMYSLVLKNGEKCKNFINVTVNNQIHWDP